MYEKLFFVFAWLFATSEAMWLGASIADNNNRGITSAAIGVVAWSLLALYLALRAIHQADLSRRLQEITSEAMNHIGKAIMEDARMERAKVTKPTNRVRRPRPTKKAAKK